MVKAPGAAAGVADLALADFAAVVADVDAGVALLPAGVAAFVAGGAALVAGGGVCAIRMAGKRISNARIFPG